MTGISIGVHVHAEPRSLLRTLDSLRRNTSLEHTLLLLPDGPDAGTRATLDTIKDVPLSGTTQPLGPAACFNRLAAYSDAGILVLLESGSLVGPLWLEHLLAALNSDERNGLAGPSTNHAWNEQRAFPHGAGRSLEEVALTAHEAFRRFDRQTRTLEPLYSLADFCYVVRREVLLTIGAADERYGLGPCWEMDYNIRAARAGFRGVWACAAYVYRSPFTARRRREEARRFEASKRLYQDKFCGARLRGEKKSYRSHCAGDACRNFAPPSLIKIQSSQNEQGGEPPVLVRPAMHSSETTAAGGQLTWLEVAAPVASQRPEPAPLSGLTAGSLAPLSDSLIITQPEPLVSCIMPTYNRRRFVPQAIRNFLRQTYTNLELLIVDDGTDPVRDCVPDDRRIRYLRLERKLATGAKRNYACEQAAGEFIVHWDDDDWYPDRRVKAQARELLEHGADLCGSSRVSYYEPARDRAWEYKYSGPGKSWVAGNTLAYRKSFWERNRFPEIQVGEDSRFVWSRASKIIRDLDDRTLCVAMIHGGNTSRKVTRGHFWHAVQESHIHEMLGDERYFYCTASEDSVPDQVPLISCIMPTYNRRRHLTLALEMFRAQDYPRLELIIVDDGSDAVRDLVCDEPCVRYIRLEARASIGTKRNLACKHAAGSIIAHWDDDDWYAPERLRYQSASILSGEADLTGLESSFVLDLPSGQFWTAQPHLHRRMFVGNVHGGTLVYRRELLAEGVRYPETNLAEDAAFLSRATKLGKRLLKLSNPGIFVYVRHDQNAWKAFKPGRFISPAGWEHINPPPTFHPQLLESYRRVAS